MKFVVITVVKLYWPNQKQIKNFGSENIKVKNYKIIIKKKIYKLAIVKHSHQVIIHIQILQEVQNSNYFDTFETLCIKNNPKYVINN